MIKQVTDLISQSDYFLNNFVRYANLVARSSQRLSLLQQRIIMCALAKIPFDKAITGDDTFYVSFSELRSLGGSGSNNSYLQLKKAAVELMMKFVTLPDKERPGRSAWIFPWVQAAHYDDDKQCIAIRFSNAIIPMISQLKDRFTQYRIGELIGLRSIYSQPLYARLMRFMRNPTNSAIKSKWIDHIEVNELRFILDATSDSYKEWTPFKRRVLDPAIDEINTSPYTRFSIRYSIFERQNRAITKLKFEMRARSKTLKLGYDPLNEVESDLTLREATLSESQMVMIADWLSGWNKRYAEQHGVSISRFVNFLVKEKLIKANLDVNDAEFFRSFLVGRLANPYFVRKIYDPWLKNLGVQLKRPVK